jgi:carboxypeptidase family protein/immune inhibitor InhA-like protein
MTNRRTLARAACTLGVVSLACLNDSPTAPLGADRGARLRIQAQIAGGQAVDRTLRIRVFYRRPTAGAAVQEVDLPSAPTEIVVTSGTTQSQVVIVNLGPCFGDAQRVGAEAGCRFSVELTLIDTDGEMLSRQAQDVTASSPGATVTATFQLVGDGSIVGRVLDAVTNEPLGGATLRLTRGTTGSPRQATAGADGRYAFSGLTSGTYSMEAIRDGHVTNAAPSVTVERLAGGDEVRVDFALPTNASTKRFASVSGRVVDATGAPLANGTVSVSGGAQTNGVFQAATADARGNFSLYGIVLDDASGQPIQQFVVSAAAPGFAPSARTVQLIRNQTLANLRFALSRATTVEYFRDDFEGAAGPAWTGTGFWNRINLATTTVTNSAYPTYVELAPDDNSEGRLPRATSGSFAFWYGQPTTGNYLGPQISGDPPLSGGTGTAPNAGRIISPAFTIAAEAAVSVSFDTWFEIESVNPNDRGFDIMSVIVARAVGVEDTLGRVNPFVDPTLGEHDPVPFTSGGYNRAPVWRTVQFDLSAYRGRTIQLVLDFDTVDPSFNGFRGWIVDNVRVTNEAVPTQSAARAASSRLSQQRTLRQPRARPAPRNPRTRSEPR